MDIAILIIVGLLNLAAGFHLGTWYCRNVKGMK